MFADRVEIISPGHLPNHLTIEKHQGWQLQYAQPDSGILCRQAAALSRTGQRPAARLAGLAAD
ncbi:hypothetical protein LNP24_28405 [Klebsiella pneumoniae subsp. pneumoniae]|nr:hypothetical protein [Klebsiella pneumoniae subsp. pneumoniae]